jgi:hypothetical protein
LHCLPQKCCCLKSTLRMHCYSPWSVDDSHSKSDFESQRIRRSQQFHHNDNADWYIFNYNSK